MKKPRRLERCYWCHRSRRSTSVRYNPGIAYWECKNVEECRTPVKPERMHTEGLWLECRGARRFVLRL